MLASRADVWRFLAEPYHFADWWPTVSAVRPDARGFREGARWEVAGPASPTLFRKGGATGLAIVKTIELHERVIWSLTADRLDVEVRLAAVEPDRTVVTVAVEGALETRGARPPARAAQGGRVSPLRAPANGRGPGRGRRFGLTMFDLRYHVASLAAVFLALVIGILVGVGISSGGFVQKGERRILNAKIDSCNEASTLLARAR